ncbi:uncharacterized protein DUF3291 [Actinomadura pelletieri DSM 43383]|uniref:Uncharacterized protein DUF3291 n=1 Tax=Actinomadura pelletieri DSM 43383 TaxID=1120940 RepID=A0A495QKF5_9ACTN|nr:DUF3291 domain-containing protein [Actinomadura pelletieri]RKS73036.1 uncharacterized protein DUF3291 [Actinomadura pelletieri DSM 43383]
MPTLPWATLIEDEPETRVVVMASRLEVRSLRHVPGFLRASLLLLRQARRADGAHGVALKAEPFRRTFWTLSAWSDRKSLAAYSKAEPHASTMRRQRAVMRDSAFVFWEATVGDLPIDWAEARRRLAES